MVRGVIHFNLVRVSYAMSFEKAFDHVVGLEGGYVDDKFDPGGVTKYGISKRAYPDEDISSLTLERAKELYRRDYWNVLRCEEMPWPLAMLVFDCGVNQGIQVAAKTLQKALGVVQDGSLGKITMLQARKAGMETCALFLADRALRYTGTRNFDRFGRGWLKRLFMIAMEA